MKNPIAAAASRFAHLAGGIARPKSAKSKAEDEKDEDKKDESASAADDDEDEKMEDDDKDTTAAAEGDDPEEEESDDDKKDGKKGKRAASDDEDCEDDDETEKKAVRKGRRIERARWSAVLSSAHAARNLQLAVTLLADTSKPAEHIVGRLRDASAAGGSADRRDRNPRVEAAEPPVRDTRVSTAASWDRAFGKTAPAQR